MSDLDDLLKFFYLASCGEGRSTIEEDLRCFGVDVSRLGREIDQVLNPIPKPWLEQARRRRRLFESEVLRGGRKAAPPPLRAPGHAPQRQAQVFFRKFPVELPPEHRQASLLEDCLILDDLDEALSHASKGARTDAPDEGS